MGKYSKQYARKSPMRISLAPVSNSKIVTQKIQVNYCALGKSSSAPNGRQMIVFDGTVNILSNAICIGGKIGRA